MNRTLWTIAGICIGVCVSSVGLLATVERTFAADQKLSKQDDTAPSRFLGLPPIACPPENPISQEKIALGRKLFFDKMLSSDSTRSCATCHVPFIGFADSDRLSVGVGLQKGHRHSLSVLNAVFYTQFMWDGRSHSLEHQALLPIATKHEMNMSHGDVIKTLKSKGMEPEFTKVFGSGGITPQRVAAALACFERTLVAGDSPYDRYHFLGDKNAMTEQQKRGLQVFTDANCASCHSINENKDWTLFTDQKFHNIGVGTADAKPDVGRFSVTQKPSDWAAFRTPSLRNVSLRPPYFHDGSAKTLSDAVDFHLKGGIKNKNLDPLLKPVKLSAQQRLDLIAFLNALTSKDIDAVISESMKDIKLR